MSLDTSIPGTQYKHSDGTINEIPPTLDDLVTYIFLTLQGTLYTAFVVAMLVFLFNFRVEQLYYSNNTTKAKTD